MQARFYSYLIAYTSPIVFMISLMQTGWASYFSLVFVFLIVPVFEYLIGTSSKNLDDVSIEIAKSSKIYDLLIYTIVPIQVGLMVFFLNKVSHPGLDWITRIGYIISYGMAGGVLGINVAHELGHRSTWYEQTMSKILLCTTLYMHFFIEHNRGHHNNVATDEDPASARYGEHLYAFVLRSIKDSYLSAWQLERKRLGDGSLSLKNEMLQYHLIQGAMLVAIGYFFGIFTLLFYLVAALIGCIMLEIVNYIEHYGLRRKKANEKRYERTLPIHSWNSDHILGRLLLFELTRHSDHHYQSDRKYQVLRHFDESPQLPAGYPSMMLLSMFPPLWFKVMDPRVEAYKNSPMGTALA
jgi:alkane 1-monooxygenase